MALVLNEQYLEGFVTWEELEAYSGPLQEAHHRLHAPDGQPKGWLDLPADPDAGLLDRIEAAARRIREDSDLLLVIGIGGSYLGARAALDFLPGNRNGCRVLFIGNDLSPSHLEEVLEKCRGRDFSLNVISKSGSTTEPAIAFRILYQLLCQRYGSRAAERVYCTTDPEEGILRRMCDEEGFTRFEIPRDVGGRYSVLTPVGLLPIAAAGYNIRALLAGAAQARENCREASLQNTAYRYAAIRDILYRKGKQTEIFAAYEPFAAMLLQWLIQLYGESCGKEGQGIFPTAALFSTDLHSLGQYIQEGRRMLCETVIALKETGCELTVPALGSDHDGLGYLEGRPLSEINQAAMMATATAHHAGGVPTLLLTADRRDEQTLGELFYFFEVSCAISGYLLGINPFDQPGVEQYKKNMFRLLGKPGYGDDPVK